MPAKKKVETEDVGIEIDADEDLLDMQSEAAEAAEPVIEAPEPRLKAGGEKQVKEDVIVDVRKGSRSVIGSADPSHPDAVRYNARPGYSLIQKDGEIEFPFVTADKELQKKIEGGRGWRANEIWRDDRTPEEAAAEEAALERLSFDKLRRMVKALGFRDIQKYSKAELIDILARAGAF